MRTVDAHLLGDKIDEAVTHYINSHQTNEGVHVDAGALSLNVQVDSNRVVTVMHGQGFSQMSRQVLVSEAAGEGPWTEELLDSDERLDALVAHLAQHSRSSHHHGSHHKVPHVRGDVDTSVILDTPLRLFNGQTLESQTEPIVVQVPHLPPLPPLQMKRCGADWFSSKHKNTESEILSEASPAVLELSACSSPAQLKQNKKSLPHKKRISRKLKRAGNTTPHQDIVVLNCSESSPQEEILPDNFVGAAPHTDAHHIAHEMRALFICQLCGEFYGDEQLKFYQHLRQHYEPLMMESPRVPDLPIDKMSSTCIVDSGATLPDSIVELSLERAVPKSTYQPLDKPLLYSNKLHYSMANLNKDASAAGAEAQAAAEAHAEAESQADVEIEIYSCSKCNKSFRKQKHCEAHIMEVHPPKLEDMGEFSEPEDLMEGIHVSVEEPYECPLLPHLTVENGHVRQEHVRTWSYLRGGEAALGGCAGDGAYCPVCPPPAPAPPPAPRAEPQQQLKEEVLQRILEAEVARNEQAFTENMIAENTEIPHEPEPGAAPEPAPEPGAGPKAPKRKQGKSKVKDFECLHCGRVFNHRNSLLYHALSHSEKQHECRECGKGFYTASALKIHKRLHSGDRPYKCGDCGREFRQWSDLKYHRVSLHSAKKQFKCEFCEKEFARKYSLDVHRRIHTGERNYKCSYCSKTFRASSYRLTHMRTHTGDRPYNCNECSKCFRVVGDLRRHALTHTKSRARLEGVSHTVERPSLAIEEDKQPSGPAKRTNQGEKRKGKGKTRAELKTFKVEPEEVMQKIKKIATASTTRPPQTKKDAKKPSKSKKTQTKKGSIGGAPNVTVSNKNEPFKMTDYPHAVEAFDTRQEFSKFKEVYTEGNANEIREISYKTKAYEQISYKDEQRLHEDRELSILRPAFRSSVCEREVYEYRPENTDGKMQVYTHIEKAKEGSPTAVGSTVTLGDIRNLERERELQGDTLENGFLEKLTAAFYNIPAV